MSANRFEFIPLDQLGKHVEDTEACLRRAQELYDEEPTRAHLDNLNEAKAEHALFLSRTSQR